MLEEKINHYFDIRDTLSPQKAPSELLDALTDVFNQLDQGSIRVAEPKDGDWVVNAWIKKAILLSFKCYENQVIEGKHARFYDKLPLKFSDTSAEQFAEQGVRVVPDAIARRGSFIGKNTILMPSYVNIGAYIDEGAMIDTWATVGSCAQIGKNVHLSGGAGIGGVLEPLQAEPTIIEDHCFIGARSEVVEGVIVEHHSVISMGVFIGQSTKIYNRLTGEITMGRVPAGSVVVPGSLPSKDGSHSLACAVIIKQVDERTRSKVGINELLRDNATC
ncbi:MAG: 2,3,4,5-tetrahydropyridine-2,6-dicarboxylate N-succinyltransferase [Gammaproteobacteria bacterium]|nr:2,3,4,5-tetrahydropyridine-2,6-dicarboxylate N-succinyltransferase [Gammaproteobacteria bacterium]